MKQFWMQRRWELLGLSGAVALTLVALAGIGWFFTQSGVSALVAKPADMSTSVMVTEADGSIARVPATDASANPTVELSSEESGEFQRRHLRRNDGTLLRTQIEYRNGEIGVLDYRVDGSRERFTRIASDGQTVLSQQVYDASGSELVEGWSKRRDNTLAWRVTTLTGGKVVEKTVFFSDGKKVFLKQITDSETKTVESWYWGENGLLQLHQKAPADSVDRPTEEDIYNPFTGRIAQSSILRNDGGADVSFFRIDGSLYFTRHYRMHYAGTTTERGYLNLDATTVYGSDGMTVVMLIRWFWELKPMSITVMYPDGSKSVHNYTHAPKAEGVERYGPDKRLVSQSKTGADPALFFKLEWSMWAKEIPAAQDMREQLDKLLRDT